MTTTRSDLLSIGDLSDELGVPVSTIYTWNSRGTGPNYLKVGRHVRYRRADVDAWLDSLAAKQRKAQA